LTLAILAALDAMDDDVRNLERNLEFQRILKTACHLEKLDRTDLEKSEFFFVTRAVDQNFENGREITNNNTTTTIT
jgi:hypothetical protein